MKRYIVSVCGVLALSLAVIASGHVTTVRFVVPSEVAYTNYAPYLEVSHAAPFVSEQRAILPDRGYASRHSLTGHYTPFMPAVAFDGLSPGASRIERYDKGRARQLV